MVKFAKTYFDIKYHAIEDQNGLNNDCSNFHQQNNKMVETISVTAPPVPKAVVVTSPAKQAPKGQWIKIHNPQSTKRSHVMINGNKIGRDQIIKTTLRPSLSYPFKQSNGSVNVNKTFHKLSDYLPNNKAKMNDFVVHLNQSGGVSQQPKVIVSKKGCRWQCHAHSWKINLWRTKMSMLCWIQILRRM